MNLTEGQRRAIFTHDKNLIVVAGAGSGKTRVLVERYLALLDNHPDWPLNALVAVTFTRKAAQEMRDRVRSALQDRLNSTPDEAAQALWAERLASMDSARIDTIHGLCTTILRANAAEAGIDPDFDVLDETDAAILLDAVIEDELARLEEEGDPALALFQEYDRRSINQTLLQFDGVTLAPLPDDLLAHWQTLWEVVALDCIARLRHNDSLRAFLDWHPPNVWPEDDRLAETWMNCHACLETLLNPTAAAEACLEALAKLEQIKLTGGSWKKWGGRDILSTVREHLDVVRSQAKKTLEEIGTRPGPLDERAIELLPLWVQLIGRVQRAYRAAKQREGRLDFNDLEQRTRDLFRAYPQLKQRYQQAEFRHVLVDEFQDTNAIQWEIIQNLADPAQPGSLFVVGDQKQSIYAFRGADVSVFGAVRQQLTHLGGPDAEVTLARSFRTHQPLIDCFNGIFGRILQRDSASAVYAYETELGEPMDASRLQPPDDCPALEFVLVDSEVADKNGRRETCRRWEAYEIARRLQAMVEDQVRTHQRGAGERPLEYGDIALLFQSMNSITLYEDVFKALGLPFITVAGRGYYNRPEVWDLLNLLKALYNPADNLALAAVLRSPLFGLSDDALLALRLIADEAGRPVLLWDALSVPDAVPAGEAALVVFARDCLYNLAALAGRVTIAELLREAVNRTGFMATLTGLPDGARRRGNVEKLLAKAESSGRITLSAFEQYLDDLSEREARESEAQMAAEGRVSLMTVHASKGLEFPVVVLVDCSWERRNQGGDMLLHDPDYGLSCKVYDNESEGLKPTFAYEQASFRRKQREQAERKRLLYVAATRAQDYLLICGQVDRTNDGWNPKGWLKWLLEACDLQSELDTAGVQIISRAWGQVRLSLSATLPPEEHLDAADSRQRAAWDRLTLEDPLHPGGMMPPPLLEPVRYDPAAAARHLSVTQLADLGGHEYDRMSGERFRRGVLHDAPGHLSPVPYPKSWARLVGEMVHEALRWQQPGQDAEDVARLLESYAWEQGIVDDVERQRAVEEAQGLLMRYRRSPVYQWIRQAEELYQELPFIYNNGQHIVHGVIDALFRRPDGVWVIVDYKTSTLAQATPAVAQQHARRFHMQVGAYADAVREQLQMVDGAGLLVYIHYVRYGLTVEVTRDEWQKALEKMEPAIGRLIGT